MEPLRLALIFLGISLSLKNIMQKICINYQKFLKIIIIIMLKKCFINYKIKDKFLQELQLILIFYTLVAKQIVMIIYLYIIKLMLIEMVMEFVLFNMDIQILDRNINGLNIILQERNFVTMDLLKLNLVKLILKIILFILKLKKKIIQKLKKKLSL